MVELAPGRVSLAQWRAIVHAAGPVTLERSARSRVIRSAAIVQEAARGDAPVYGVNTGFGKLAHIRIPPEETAQLQRNLIRSHECGVGDPLPDSVVRLAMAMKINAFGQGASGVRWTLVESLEAMLARGVTPLVPGQGSVGASGDLAPLAHIAAVMIGEGRARFKGDIMPGGEALGKAGIAPLALAPKEGLALVNGTQISTALALVALFEAERFAKAALVTGALSTDAAMASSAPFHDAIHALRNHAGQRAVAKTLHALLDGSAIRQSHRTADERVQDPYCLRCQPQVMGACMDVMGQVARTLEAEANAVTDNPLVIPEDGSILSGGNFHAEPVALAADQLALAIAETGAIAQRRIALLVDPALNYGLPPFLAASPGLHAGFMAAEITSAALMSENKQRAAPCSVDSTPTSANQEDHVSMATHAARRLGAMNRNLAHIVAIEWMAAAQGVEWRAPLTTSEPLQECIALLRAHVPGLTRDRAMAEDIARAAGLLKEGALAECAARRLAAPLLREEPA